MWFEKNFRTLKICQEFFLSELASVIALQRQDQSRKVVVEELSMVVLVVMVVMVVAGNQAGSLDN